MTEQRTAADPDTAIAATTPAAPVAAPVARGTQLAIAALRSRPQRRIVGH